MGNRLLVLGASGFLGRRLHAGFPEFEVIGTGFTHLNPDLIELDLRDIQATLNFIARVRPDRIIYSAAVSTVTDCERNKKDAHLVNTATPSHIAASTSCPILYVSTDYVFDGTHAWYKENYPPCPISYYGKSKVGGEQAVLSASPNNTVLRLSGLYDEHGTAKGQHSKVAHGRSDLISAPVHVNDVVAAVRLIFERAATGLVHAGGPTRLTRYDFLQLTRLKYDHAPNVIPYEDPEDHLRPKCSALDSTRLRSLSWSARDPASVFVKATNHDSDVLHISGLKGSNNKILALDTIGCLLAPLKRDGSDLLLEGIDQACAKVTDEAKFWTGAIRETGDIDIIDRVCDRYLINSSLWRYIITWRAMGCRLVATNDGPSETFLRWRARLGLDRWFYDTLNSVEAGCLKTDPAYFSKLTKRLKYDPSSIILLDDNSDICRMARAKGIHSFVTRKVPRDVIDTFHVVKFDDLQRLIGIDVSREEALDLCEPDSRFFRQLRIHAQVFKRPNRRRYFMLSSGTNQLPAWSEWKRLANLEIEEQLAYSWYTPQTGFPLLSHSAALYENSAALGRFCPSRSVFGRYAAMTFGASQAVALTLDYLAEIYPSQPILVVEPCYPLIYRQAARSRLGLIPATINDFTKNSMLPTPCQITSLIEKNRPCAVFLSLPLNPSGETYSCVDLLKIGHSCADYGAALVIDRTGELPNDIPTTRALSVAGLIDERALQCIVINSLSKSEALAGYRIGYVIGPSDLVSSVAAKQLYDSMNPPTTPALPIFFVLMLRCAMLDNKLTAVARFANRMFRSTTAIAPNRIVYLVEELLAEQFGKLFGSYVEHHDQIRGTIDRNENLLKACFQDEVVSATRPAAGINQAVIFASSIGRSEDAFCRSALNNSDVAVVTESCFRRHAPSRPWYWTRASLATDTQAFVNACERLAESM